MSRFFNAVDKLADFVFANIAFTFGVIGMFIGMLNQNTYTIALATLYFVLHAIREIKRLSISDSPTPQNWVYYEVTVRGNGIEYTEYVVVMEHTVDNPYNRIDKFYKEDGKEVLDINIHFVTKRI